MAIWTDGACRGNPGPGAWAFYAQCEGNGYDMYEYINDTTNNKMELEAVKQALIYITKINTNAKVIHIYTDSNYIISVFSRWIWGWMQKGTITQKKNFETILDIQLLLTLQRADGYIVDFIKVKGHSENVGNKRADANCNFAMDVQSKSKPLLSSTTTGINRLRHICPNQDLSRFNRIFKWI